MDKVRILVADDQTQFRQALCLAIAQTDDLEVVANSGDRDQAIELGKVLQPVVVVVSVTLSGMKPRQLIKQIKQVCPKAAIIVVSSYTHGVYILPSLRAGALGYVIRDSPLDELINDIRSVRAGQLVFDSKVVAKILQLVDAEPCEEAATYELLHRREIEVLKLLAKGKHNKDIASELHVSEHTVHSHLINIFQKLGCCSRTGAVLHALKEGLLTFDDLP